MFEESMIACSEVWISSKLFQIYIFVHLPPTDYFLRLRETRNRMDISVHLYPSLRVILPIK